MFLMILPEQCTTVVFSEDSITYWAYTSLALKRVKIVYYLSKQKIIAVKQLCLYFLFLKVK